MRILHTADWHLGKRLYGKKRHEEFEAFLAWLMTTIRQERIDILLITGDIFDTNTPGNRTQQLYYSFLRQLIDSPCRHVVITAGNHDSPSFLAAPRELLHAFNIHIVGSISEDPADEVITLHDTDGIPEAIICAVPYLRDRDLRSSEAGESTEEKEKKLLEGIRNHYAAVAAIASQKRTACKNPIPIIATGHLFAAGGKRTEDDGVRELYIGTLSRITADVFSDAFDYVALGHLHSAQKVNNADNIRYSGSPLPMSFSEAGQQKILYVLEWDENNTRMTIDSITIPPLQHLERIKGKRTDILNAVQQLTHTSAWLEILYEGKEPVEDLRDVLEAMIADSNVVILRIKSNRHDTLSLSQKHPLETLEDLSSTDVFERCLKKHDIPEEQRSSLRETYQEALRLLHEKDSMAEKT